MLSLTAGEAEKNLGGHGEPFQPFKQGMIVAYKYVDGKKLEPGDGLRGRANVTLGMSMGCVRQIGIQKGFKEFGLHMEGWNLQ